MFFVLLCCLKVYKKNIYTPELKLEKDLPIFVSNDFFSEEQVSSEDIFKNDNYYVINIWASWCIPCKEEHSFLLNLKNKNIELVGINYKDNENSALQFLNELGNPYKKIFKDREGVLSIELGAYGVPETFIINKQKKIIKK